MGNLCTFLHLEGDTAETHVNPEKYAQFLWRIVLKLKLLPFASVPSSSAHTREGLSVFIDNAESIQNPFGIYAAFMLSCTPETYAAF